MDEALNKMQIFFVLLLSSACYHLPAQDKFAAIGAGKYDTRTNLLVEPQPLVLPGIDLPVTNNTAAAFKISKPVSTKEELYRQLDSLKKQYSPFLQNLAPSVIPGRKQFPLNSFLWRIETPGDIKNFSPDLKGAGEWQTVQISHYGPPLGRAVTYYFKEVNFSEEDLSGKNLFICFKGVDYKASVFLNGSYIGSHEGFFAPFEFNVTRAAHAGANTLLVKVENDFTTLGGKDDKGNPVVGDKIYAASGPGYDDPVLGWHHCPAGMGIYQDCYFETRNPVHVNDLFVRPQLKDSIAEAWIEVNNYKDFPENVKLKISVYGQNFKDTVIQNMEYIPGTVYIPGVGDLAKPSDWETSELKMGYGVNFLRVPLKMKNFRLWQTDAPWLYQLQVSVCDSAGKQLDTKCQQFGMRSFTMDTVNIPKGKMFLNGEMIRLRGANSMGFEQQDVMKKNEDQLINDILLGKLCNLNYFRFTQRPVQSEVYDMCDKLGMLNQTDLPLFGSLRRNKFAEAVKQAEEMERLVRKHPSTIMVTYINERFPNAEGHPQRSFNTAEEYYQLFTALDQAVLLSNPDRIIKAGDGDYDPPSPGLPDNHCYNTWYNGHGLPLGKMYKGYWQLVKPGWYYGCGEFGAEGLDPLNVMKKYYPASWLPATNEEEKTWNGSKISQAQTPKFYYMWFNAQHSVKDWIAASQAHQAWALQFVSECFRRDARMVSFAVHLFIDAWPAGWMKTIMDVDRQPKKAFFAYRHALEPLMVSLRSDRNHFFSGDTTSFEIWICNDLNKASKDYTLHYQVEQDEKIIFANSVTANIPVNSSAFQGFLKYKTPLVKYRTKYTLRAALMNNKGESVYQNEFEFEVHPTVHQSNKKIFIAGNNNNVNEIIARSGYTTTPAMQGADVIVVADFNAYKQNEQQMNTFVRQGKKIIFIELPAQQYQIASTSVKIEKTVMGNYYFASPATGHALTQKYEPFDFHLWYDEKDKLISPFLEYVISAPQWETVIASGNSKWQSDAYPLMAVAQLQYGKGVFRICELQFNHKLQSNPMAKQFFNDLINR